MAVERKRSTRRSVRHRGVPSDQHQQPRQRPVSKCKNCCRKFIAFLFSHVGLCALVVAYAIGGAFMFRKLEASHEVEKASQVIRMRNQTVQRLWIITYDYNILNKTEWSHNVTNEIKHFQNNLMNAIKDGYEGKDGGMDSQQWSFSGAFLFSLTVISTIGYGNICPRTEPGKIATILYAIVGIPLMLLYLTNIGDILAKSFRYVYGRLCTCKPDTSKRTLVRSRSVRHAGLQRSASSITPSAYQRSQIYHTGNSLPNSPYPTLNRVVGGMIHGGSSARLGATVSMTDHANVMMGEGNTQLPDARFDFPEFDIINEGQRAKQTTARIHVPITLCLLILTSYICGGGLLFSVWEEWDFLDGSYFCFVTLSTIGFGDLVPGSSIVGDEGSQRKLVICSLYLLTGLALLAMCFNLMQEEVIHKMKNCGKRLGVIKDTEIEEEFDDEFDMP